ncbi:MAG: hypothetical protein PVJ21_12455 [Anaerolineales bacterium]|jgi:hypothetical protein
MTIIEIIIVVFIFLELSNVVMLYFAPGSKYANAVGVFASWEKSKQYPEIHEFIKYLVNWIAGSKLIFIFILIGIITNGERQIQRVSLIALAVAALSFYWRLFPLIRKMDKRGEISPKNFSVILGIMIFIFIIAFLIGAIV